MRVVIEESRPGELCSADPIIVRVKAGAMFKRALEEVSEWLRKGSGTRSGKRERSTAGQGTVRVISDLAETTTKLYEERVARMQEDILEAVREHLR